MALRTILGLAGLSLARDITFPPVQHPLGVETDAPGLSEDISLAKFAGLTTFANLPYVHCLSSDEEVDPYDIAILGAPFDTAVTARPGARFGPLGIREGSRRISSSFGYSIYTGQNPFDQGFKIVDCGDAPLTVLDNTVALRQLGKSHQVTSSRKTNSTKYTVPRIIALGGDHTTTLPALRSTFRHWGPVSIIHFDSHLDTWDPELLGGGLSHYSGVNHGTFLHIAHEEGLVLNSSIHAGIRAPVQNRKYDLKNDKACGFHILTARDLDKLGMAGFVQKIKERVQGTRVYITVDIDTLDPAFAPATGTAEPGGWTSRELLSVLDSLSGLEVIGADVVEVAPIYDNPGETTTLAAAEIVRSLIQIMVDTPVVTSDAVHRDER
ncbi:hypothetical protein BST61_g5314 [Cercospora zeina]